MRAVVQRVSAASVTVRPEDDAAYVSGAIEHGLLCYVAAAPDDGPADAAYIAEKVAGLRVFSDAEGKLNLDVSQVGGKVLLVSAFSVLADARKGRRPSFAGAAAGEVAAPLMEAVREGLQARGVGVETGQFAASMQVQSVNEGPICILLDSRRLI